MNVKGQKAAVCMGKKSVKVQELIKNFPPEYQNATKRAYYEKAAYIHRHQKGIIKISRWRFADERKTPLELIRKPIIVETDSKFFDYSDKDTETKRVFYLNFADPLLFGYYATNLFAQDEIQTFEHPLLGSVAEYLEAAKIQELVPLTDVKIRADDAKHSLVHMPTPYIVENVPYWIRVNTSPALADGRMGNIYGRKFSIACKYAESLSDSEQRKLAREIIGKAFTLIEKEEKNNILAMAAPSSGYGNDPYTSEQLTLILQCLLAGFGGAAKCTSESKRKECVIHTGNWGCGAFGNDKELIYLMQLFCASVTGISKIVFHGLSDADKKLLENAQKKLSELKDYEPLMDFLLAQNYHWHFGDGN